MKYPVIIEQLAWDKMENQIPAIIQDHKTLQVLMLGYMNQDALQTTLQDNKVTFYSRSKQRLWTKGETSKNYLQLIDIKKDCDSDALLLLVEPQGPTCHEGDVSCFKHNANESIGLLMHLESVIADRKANMPEGSYTTELFNAGLARIAQKVGEEGVEVALASVTASDDELCGEVADLLYHVLVLLQAKELNLADVLAVLKNR